VRNVAGLSYTTSSAFIFSSRSRFWASNSAIAALVDAGPLVHLIAALWCRSKLALTWGKEVVEGRPWGRSLRPTIDHGHGRRDALHVHSPSLSPDDADDAHAVGRAEATAPRRGRD